MRERHEWTWNKPGMGQRQCSKCGKVSTIRSHSTLGGCKSPTKEEANEIVKAAAGRRPDFPDGKDYVDEVRGHESSPDSGKLQHILDRLFGMNPLTVEEASAQIIAYFGDEVSCVGLELCCDLEAKVKEAMKQERERIIAILKRTTGYKLMQRMPNGRYFETTTHDNDWERFRQALKEED